MGILMKYGLINYHNVNWNFGAKIRDLGSCLDA